MWRSEISRWLGCAALLLAGVAQAQHFDVELRTDKGPVAGSRIVAEFFGDLGLAGKLPIDAATGYRIFPAYFGDFAGGPYATANPGFQAFNGTFVAGEEIHFRALGTLLHWTPASGTWTPAPAGVRLTLYGGIPPEVVIGYTTNPTQWAAQYAYYQGGTRYDGQGVTGPLTAAIDDVRPGGSFHSHLDWKITSTAGTPPAGAYLLTLELWSPTLSAGQPKYLASQPLHVLFERGLTEAQMQAAFNSRISPPCPARAMNWTVGAASCSASVAATATGAFAVATDSAEPATGSATFACTNGSWGAATQASCTAPPAACPAQPTSWSVAGNSCSAALPASPSGASALAADTAWPATGSASFTCRDGAWSAAANASCSLPPPADCAAQPMSWAVGDNRCSAAVPATLSGAAAVATDDTAQATGSARFACTNGSWGGATQASCTVPAPSACEAVAVSWSAGSERCTGTLAATPSGSAAIASDAIAPAVGQATFSCTAGAWSAPAAAACAVPAPPACPAQALTWTVGAQTCTAPAAAAPSGTALLAADDDGEATGSASFACSAGAWSAPAAASCAAAGPLPAARTPAPPWAPPAQRPWDKPRR